MKPRRNQDCLSQLLLLKVYEIILKRNVEPALYNSELQSPPQMLTQHTTSINKHTQQDAYRQMVDSYEELSSKLTQYKVTATPNRLRPQVEALTKLTESLTKAKAVKGKRKVTDSQLQQRQRQAVFPECRALHLFFYSYCFCVKRKDIVWSSL